jgi:type I restriction enzyme S subunit
MTFSELVTSGVLHVSDGYRAKNDELGGDGPIFLRAGLVTDTHIDLTEAERFRHPWSPQIVTKLAKPNDVVVTTKGNSTGRVVRIREGMPESVYSPHLSFWRSLDARVIDSGFLYYWSRSTLFRHQLDGMKVSTDMAPYLSLVDQSRLRIELPTIGRQRAISRILGALDDKIELNRRTNETLEAMARALFQSWFVDFDPVRAKMEGRQPEGMDAETAKLFPGSLVPSGIGPIPKGWREGTLEDQLVLQRGFDLPHNNRIAGSVPVIAASGECGTHNEARVSGPGVVTGRSGVLGNVYYEVGDYWPLNTTLYVREFRESSPTHAFFSLERIDFKAFNAGSAVPSLNRNHVHTLKACLAPKAVVNQFERVASSILLACRERVRESTTLTTLRDALLPKLLSGELRVPEAERLASEVL